VKPFRRLLAAAAGIVLGLGASALALVGGAPPAEETVARHVLLVLAARDGRRDACTGTAIAQDLVLTAAHCFAPGAGITVARTPGRDGKRFRVVQTETHPNYSLDAGPGAPAVDLALLKLAEPLPAAAVPAPLGRRALILIGERFIVAGYGISGGEGEFGILRAATLMAVRSPSEQHFLLADPATRGETAGLGVCSGDSGGPVFDPAGAPLALVAVVSWAATARHLPGCGGLTGATAISPFRDWIVETAKKLGSPLPP
jgi:hypothetical protein